MESNLAKYAPWIGSAVAGAIAMISFAVAIGNFSQISSAREEARQARAAAHEVNNRLRVATILAVNNNESRNFFIRNWDMTKGNAPSAEVRLSFAVSAFQTMAPAARQELVDVQHSIWTKALKEVYGVVPPGNILWVDGMSSFGKNETREIGCWRDGKWEDAK